MRRHGRTMAWSKRTCCPRSNAVCCNGGALGRQSQRTAFSSLKTQTRQAAARPARRRCSGRHALHGVASEAGALIGAGGRLRLVALAVVLLASCAARRCEARQQRGQQRETHPGTGSGSKCRPSLQTPCRRRTGRAAASGQAAGGGISSAQINRVSRGSARTLAIMFNTTMARPNFSVPPVLPVMSLMVEPYTPHQVMSRMMVRNSRPRYLSLHVCVRTHADKPARELHIPHVTSGAART